jgi:hypothetical protein
MQSTEIEELFTFIFREKFDGKSYPYFKDRTECFDDYLSMHAK